MLIQFFFPFKSLHFDCQCVTETPSGQTYFDRELAVVNSYGERKNL